MQKSYGYVRVSSKDQNIGRQIEALKKANIQDEHIYIDKQSGKDFDRKSYKELIEILKQGDILFVKSIDRLGRDYDEIINQWRYLNKIRKVDIVVLDFPLLDTRAKEKDLTGTFIADLVLQILSYVAQTERENIKQRQKEGIELAKRKGIHFGRPQKQKPDTFYQIVSQYQQKKISGREAAKQLDIHHTTFFRWLNEIEADDHHRMI